MNEQQERDINPGLVSQDSTFADADSIDALLHQLAGAASVCWENPGGAGVFQSDLADEFVQKAKTRLADLLFVSSVEPDFTRDLTRLCNRYCLENVSDTPDHILAEYINGCLQTFNETVRKRDEWYGFMSWPDRNIGA